MPLVSSLVARIWNRDWGDWHPGIALSNLPDKKSLIRNKNTNVSRKWGLTSKCSMLCKARCVSNSHCKIHKIGEQDCDNCPCRDKKSPFAELGVSFIHPEKASKFLCFSADIPIRIPGYPEPFDPLVWEDRPDEVEDKGEIGHRPCDEPVEFGRTAP